MMLDHLANDSVESLSSSDEEDNDFIHLELACIPKSCFETRLLQREAAGAVENGPQCRYVVIGGQLPQLYNP